MRLVRLICFAVVFAIIVVGLVRAQAGPPTGYYLVWSDEFAGSSMDTDKWSYRALGPRRDAVNVTDAVSVENGDLVITTYTSGGTHYTGMIGTQGTFRSRYGYYEASIDFDSRPGMWSAFWMQSPTMGSPLGDPATAGTEIDIQEHRLVNGSGNDISNRMQSALHWDGYGSHHKSASSGLSGNLGLASGYHTYGLLWTDSSYRFSVDGSATWTTSQAVSRRSEYVILSSEVQNGSWAGNIPSGGYGSLASSTAKMKVAYVRYYAPDSVSFWSGEGNSTWTSSANWVAGRTPTANSEVVFGDLSVANRSCTLDGTFTLSRLTVNETDGPVSLSGGQIHLGSGGIDMVSASQNVAIGSEIALTSSQTWNVASSRSLTVSGPIHGGVALSKAGAGTLILTGSGINLNGLVVNGGNVRFADSSTTSLNSLQVGDTGNATVTIQDTATLSLGDFYLGQSPGLKGDASQSGGSVTVSGQFRLGHWPNETSTYSMSGGTLTLTGTPSSGTETNGVLYIGIDGTGVFSHSGGDIRAAGMRLDNRSDTGGTDTYAMTGGTLMLGGWGISGNASTQVNLGGGTIAASANWTGSLPMTLTGNSGNVTFDTNGNTIDLSGVLSGSGGLIKVGPGTLTLTGNNTYTGTTTISDGTLTFSTPSFNTYRGGAITIEGPATMNVVTTGGYNRYDFQHKTIQWDSTGGGTLSLGSDINFVLDTASSGTTTFKTNGGVQNSIVGPGGINTGSPGHTVVFDIALGTDAVDLVVSANMWNGGSLNKTGPGTLALTGNNTYTGTTTIDAGTLLVNGSLAGGSTVTVNGGTLGGTGTIGSSTTITSGGFLAPGASIGTLTIDNTLDISGATAGIGSQLFELGPGLTSDTVAIGGSNVLTIGTLDWDDFVFIDLGVDTAGVYTLFETQTTISGSLGTNLEGTIGVFSAVLSLANNDQDIILTLTNAVPEPSTLAMLLGLAGIGLLGRMRRWRS